MIEDGGLNSNDIIGKIRDPKGKNIPLFGKNFLEDIHDKMVNRVKGVNPNPSQKKASSPMNNKANAVIEADIQLRTNVKDLVESLIELGDAEIAKKLLSEHIAMLKDVLNSFKKP